jgi:NPL4 family
MEGLKKALREKVWVEVMADFHCLLFLLETGIMDLDSFKLVLKAVGTRAQGDIDLAIESAGWKTVRVILDEVQVGNVAAGPSGMGGSSRNDSPWSCRHCTFHNLSGENCEMCGLPRD